MGGFDVRHLLEAATLMLVALVLALPVGFERERTAGRGIGLRTFPLVAVASCAYVLLSAEVVGAGTDAQSRVIQGLMTGIGFLGAGAILKGERAVTGSATAASIWATGALGAAVGYRALEVAVALAVVNFLVLKVLTPLRARLVPLADAAPPVDRSRAPGGEPNASHDDE